MVDFTVEEESNDGSTSTPKQTNTTNNEEATGTATANPYTNTNTTTSTTTEAEQPTGLSSFGMRPIMYGVLILYFLVSSYFRSNATGTEQSATSPKTSSSSNKHPTISTSTDAFGDDEDDEFGSFDDEVNYNDDINNDDDDDQLSQLNNDMSKTNTKYSASTSKISMHSIKVMICTAWGYRRNFQELRQYLVQKFPQLDSSSIQAENYPSPEPAATIAMVTQTLQLLSMPLLFFGDSLFGGPEQQPEWYRVVLDNKMALFFGVYLINVFAQNAAQTGAFEIVHNGKTVFSKLQESRLPNIQEIVNGLSRNGLKTV